MGGYYPLAAPDEDEQRRRELAQQGYPLGDQSGAPVFPVSPEYAAKADTPAIPAVPLSPRISATPSLSPSALTRRAISSRAPNDAVPALPALSTSGDDHELSSVLRTPTPQPRDGDGGPRPRLVRRSGEPVDASASSPIMTASGYAPVGGTDDLERHTSLASYRGPDAVPAVGTPSEERLKKLTTSGAPPVEPLHGWKKGLDIAGQLFAPTRGLEKSLRYGPQTRYAENLKQAEGDVEAEQKPQEEQAKTQELQSRGEFEQAHADAARNPKDTWKNVPNLIGPNGEPVELNERTGEHRYGQLQGAKPLKTPGETQEQNKLGYQGVIGKLDAAGLPTDPKSIDKSLDSALKAGKITPEEHATARSYQAANTTPGTNLTVHVEGQQAAQNVKDQRAHVLATDSDGKTILTTQAEASQRGIDSIPVKDPETVVQTGRMANSIQVSVNRLADPKLLAVFDDPMARAVIATATSPDHARQFGAVIPGFGGLMVPVPGGTSKFIDSVLQNYAGKNKEAVKQYLSNYWSAQEALMNLMRLQSGGKQGARSQLQIEAAVAQVPGGGTPSAEIAKHQLENLQEGLDVYRNGIPENMPGYKKEQSWKERGGMENVENGFKVPDGAPDAPKEDGKFLKMNGRRVAVSKGGQWVAP